MNIVRNIFAVIGALFVALCLFGLALTTISKDRKAWKKYYRDAYTFMKNYQI